MDILKKYLAYNSSVRVTVVNATDMVQKARNIHSFSNVVTAAVGRTLVMTTIMASQLKEKDNKLTIQIKGDGDIKSIVTCGDNSLKIKGYATNPNVELPLNKLGKLDVSKAIGKGYINVIKDIGLKEPYIGFCNLISGEIAEDFAYYFSTSEQTPCAILLGVNISKENNVAMACGYMIEPLPECSDEVLNILESINSNISSVTNLMIDLGSIDDVAKTITGDNDIECIYEKEPVFECDCNSSRIERAIIALGRDEAINTLEKNHGYLEINCNFCNKSYRYNKEEIEKLFKK